MKLIIFKIIHLAHTPVFAGDRIQVEWQRTSAVLVAIVGGATCEDRVLAVARNLKSNNFKTHKFLSRNIVT